MSRRLSVQQGRGRTSIGVAPPLPAAILQQFAAWWDPSDVNNATQVASKWSLWSDKSGSGNHITQGVAGNRMTIGSINGLATGAFSVNGATTQELAIAGITGLASGGARYVVHKATNMPTTGGGFGLTGTGTSEAIPFTDGKIYDSFLTTVRKDAITANPADMTIAHIYKSVSTATEFSCYQNGTLQFTTGTNTVGVPATYRVGGIGGAVVDGQIGEYIITKNKLSAADDAILMAYLRAKWGTP